MRTFFALAMVFQAVGGVVIGSFGVLVIEMLRAFYARSGKNNGSSFSPVFENGIAKQKNGNHSLPFNDEEMNQIDVAIREFLAQNKPFLKHGYSLRHLSEDLHVPLHRLSAFINRRYQVNFNDFINEYRVRYCEIKILKDEWKLKKLVAIAEESGFHNRNTFTRAFKKVTGLQPSAYLRGLKNSGRQPIPHASNSRFPSIRLPEGKE